MANINKLSSGKYRVQVYDSQGRRHRKVFPDKTSAKAYVSKLETEKNLLKLVGNELIQQPISFDDVLAEFRESKKDLRPKSIVKYNNVIDQVNRFLKSNGLHMLTDFNRAHSDAFRKQLVDSGAMPKTINFYLSAVRAIFNAQVEKDSLNKNPFSHIKMVKARIKSLAERSDEYYTEDELTSFFKECKDSPYFTAFAGLYLTGCRFEEFASLKWSNIDLAERMIMIRNHEEFMAKTASSERDIPMSNYFFTLINQLNTKSKDGYVFTSPKGHRLRERRMLERCKEIAIDAGIEKNATLHKFRHTFNSILAQNNVSYEIRQFLLGHKLQGMTAHYTKLEASKFHSEVNLLDKIFTIQD